MCTSNMSPSRCTGLSLFLASLVSLFLMQELSRFFTPPSLSDYLLLQFHTLGTYFLMRGVVRPLWNIQALGHRFFFSLYITTFLFSKEYKEFHLCPTSDTLWNDRGKGEVMTGKNLSFHWRCLFNAQEAQRRSAAHKVGFYAATFLLEAESFFLFFCCEKKKLSSTCQKKV